jgi:hypothetical protein
MRATCNRSISIAGSSRSQSSAILPPSAGMLPCQQALNRDLFDNSFIVFTSSIYKSILTPSYPKEKANFYASLTIDRIIGQPFHPACGLVRQAFVHFFFGLQPGLFPANRPSTVICQIIPSSFLLLLYCVRVGFVHEHKESVSITETWSNADRAGGRPLQCRAGDRLNAGRATALMQGGRPP